MVLVSRYLESLRWSRDLVCRACACSALAPEERRCQIQKQLSELIIFVFSNVDYVFCFDQLSRDPMTLHPRSKTHFHKLLLQCTEQALNLSCKDALSSHILWALFKTTRNAQSQRALRSQPSDREQQISLKHRFLKALEYLSLDGTDETLGQDLQESLHYIKLNTICWYLDHLARVSADRIDYQDRRNADFVRSLFLGRLANTEVFLIDCRFQYEFEGGHIRGAFNINDPRALLRLFFERESAEDFEGLRGLRSLADTRVDLARADSAVRECQRLEREANQNKPRKKKFVRMCGQDKKVLKQANKYKAKFADHFEGLHKGPRLFNGKNVLETRAEEQIYNTKSNSLPQSTKGVRLI